MAVTEKYRGDPSQKQYQIISDFSSGINVKNEDSLLKDNVGREVKNFDIIAGGLLSKRKGFVAIDIKKAVQTALSITEQEVEKMQIIKTFQFNYGSQSVISMLTATNLLVNIISEGDSFSKVTYKDVQSNQVIIQNIGQRPIMIYDRVDSVNGDVKEWFLNTWFKDNWVLASDLENIKVELRKYKLDWPFDITTGSPDYYNAIGQDKVVTGIGGRQVIQYKMTGFYTQLDNQATNTSLQEDSAFDYSYKLDDNFKLKLTMQPVFNLQLRQGFTGSSSITINSTRDVDITFLKDDFDDKQGISADTMVRALATKNLPIDVKATMTEKVDNNLVSTGIDFTFDFNISGKTVFSKTETWPLDSFTIDKDQLPSGSSNYTRVQVKLPGATEDYEVEPFLLPGVTAKQYSTFNTVTFEELLFDYTISTKPKSIDSRFIQKFIPDSFSMQNLSYNLLTLKSNEDPFTFARADNTKLKFDNDQSEDIDFNGIVQLNGYYAQIEKESNFKASLNIRKSDTRNDFGFGWLFLTLEQWARLEESVGPTPQEYIDTIIRPAFDDNASKNIDQDYEERSTYTISPSTNSEYILIAFATTKIDKTTGKLQTGLTSLEDIYQIQKNITPVQTFGIRESPFEAVENFHKTDKSFVFKNQMFTYGGSNTFFVSDVNNFSYFPLLNNFQIPSDSPIVSIISFYDSLLIATSRQQFLLSGNSPSTFEINELNNDIGVVAPLTVKNNSNYIFQLTEDGVYKVKSLYNFKDRYNVEKVDNAIKGELTPESDASAVVFQNRYYICIPSKRQIWIYYNDWNAWIKYESDVFDIEDMLVIDNKLYLVGKSGFNIYEFDETVPNEHGEGSYKDKDQWGNEYFVESVYKSKEIDFGLPNHDKKLKKLQTRFANTPGQNDVFYTVWVDSTKIIDPTKIDIIYDQAGNAVMKETTQVPQVTVIPTTRLDFPDTQFQDNRNLDGNKYDNDEDKLYELIVAGRGRAMQFELKHSEDKTLNVKNFGTILKVKKPKARRTKSQP